MSPQWPLLIFVKKYWQKGVLEKTFKSILQNVFQWSRQGSPTPYGMGCELGNLTSWALLSCYIVSPQWPQLTPHQTSLNTAPEKYGNRYLLWFFSFLVSLTNISSQLHTWGKEGTKTLNVILSADLLWLCFDVHNPCNNHIYMNFQENVFSQWWQISEFHHTDLAPPWCGEPT